MTLKLPLSMGWYGLPSNTWLLEPTRAHNPNGISIRSAMFCRAYDYDRPTDRRTDHATRSVTIGRICVRCTAMRTNKENSHKHTVGCDCDPALSRQEERIQIGYWTCRHHVSADCLQYIVMVNPCDYANHSGTKWDANIFDLLVNLRQLNHRCKKNTVRGNSVIQLPFAPLEVVRVINIRFCIYSVTDWVHDLNVVLKLELHTVLELEFEQNNKDSKCSDEITVTITTTNRNYNCSNY